MSEHASHDTSIDPTVIRTPESHDFVERLIGTTGLNLVLQHTQPPAERQPQPTIVRRLLSIIESRQGFSH